MNIFTQQVRESIIPHPTKKSFTLLKWEKAFNEIGSSSTEDIQLYKAGIWIFNELEKVRERLKDVKIDFLPKKIAIRLLCGSMNRTFNLLHHKTIPLIAENTFSVEQVMQAKVSGNIFGIDYRPDDLLTTEIDGSRFPLIYFSNLKENPSKCEHDDLDVLYKILHMTILGQYYDFIETMWEDCLWNTLIIDQTEKATFLYIKDITYDCIKAVAEYREQHLGMEFVMIAIHEWKLELNEDIKRNISNFHVKIIGSGKKREYYLEVKPSDDEDIPPTILFRMMAQEAYFDDLVNLEMPTYSNLTLEHLFNAWDIIYSLSETLINNLPKDDGVQKINKLLQYAPSINRTKLCELLSKGLTISNYLSEKIIELFTFKPEPKYEVWTHPLIKVDSNTLIPVFTASTSGNLLRTLEYWLKNSGIDFNEKGYLFEKTIRTSVEIKLKNSPIIKDYFVCPNSVSYSYNGKTEEIDIVIRIGNKILVGEAKCKVYPTEPMDYFNYLKSLKQGIEQIKRKTDLIKQDIRQFLQKIVGFNPVDLKVIEIIPFVIANRSFGVGFVIDDIPIVDLLILNKYFGDGQWEKYGIIHNEGTKTVGETIYFYKTEEEAVNNLREYILNPPQISFYKKFLKLTKNPVPRLKEDDKPVVLLRTEVEFPLPEAKF